MGNKPSQTEKDDGGLKNCKEALRQDESNKHNDADRTRNNDRKNDRDNQGTTVDYDEDIRPVQAVTFYVKLICSASTDSVRTLTINKFPVSVEELKSAIQRTFQIPTYDQKLSFGCSLMEDGKSLDFYKLKDGDQFAVEYTATVDVDDILILVSKLHDTLRFLKSVEKQLAQPHNYSATLRNQISNALNVRVIDKYVLDLFALGDKRMNNAKFFLENGDIPVVRELHSQLLKQSWSDICHTDLMVLEKAILRVIFAVCYRIPLQESHETVHISNIVASFLRVKVSFLPITVPDNPNLLASSGEQTQLLCDVILTALGCLCNVTEDDKLQENVASNEEVLKQLTGCLQTPTFMHAIHIRVLCCIENLSYNASTHKYLSNKEIITSMIMAADKNNRDVVQFEDMDLALCLKLERDLVRYFGSMVIAQLVLTKAAPLPNDVIYKAEQFINDFLLDVDHSLLHKRATKLHGFRWEDIFPIMRLVYSPYCHSSLSSGIEKTCLEVGTLGLQIILNREDEVEVLVSQGLLDYLICLPWWIPDSEEHKAHRRAKAVLEVVGSHVPLKPPSLNNIVRAKLAATSCGLEKAMKSDCYLLANMSYGCGSVD